MAMTADEYAARIEIQSILRKQGYSRYARILGLFHLNFTNDPGVIAYMVPDKGRIVINASITDADTVSLLIRHEILHEYLDHQLRMEQHVGKDAWDNRTGQMHQNSNIAGDYEISNRGYTKKDKILAKHIKLNGEELQGLVTDVDHPEWVNLTLEEIYDELNKEIKQDQQDAKQDMNDNSDPYKDDGSDSQDGQGAQGQSGDQQQQGGGSSSQSQDSEDSDSSDSGDSGDQQSSSGQSKDSNSQRKKPGKSSVKPGDRGSQDIQDLEEIQRQAEDISSQLEDSDDPDAEKTQDAMDEISDKASELEDQVKDATDKKYKTKDEVKNDKEIARRVQKIKEIFADQQERSGILSQTQNVIQQEIQKEKVAKAQRADNSYAKNPATQFKLSLNNFLKNELARGRGATWTRPSQKYDGSGILHKGRKSFDAKNIPSFNIYIDQSGSWSDQDVERGKSLIAQLNQYVKKGEIKVNYFYFAVNVHSNAEDARREGGTRGQPILNHIQQTNPTNVIIITDSDINDCNSNVVVPGGLWLLFRDGQRSKNLIDHIAGKKTTKAFDFS